MVVPVMEFLAMAVPVMADKQKLTSQVAVTCPTDMVEAILADLDPVMISPVTVAALTEDQSILDLLVAVILVVVAMITLVVEIMVNPVD